MSERTPESKTLPAHLQGWWCPMTQANCIKGQCAWFDEVHGLCAVLTLQRLEETRNEYLRRK